MPLNSIPHLSGWSLVWTCSPVSGSAVTSCASASQGRSPPMTASGSERTDSGWCEGVMPAWWFSWRAMSSSYCGRKGPNAQWLHTSKDTQQALTHSHLSCPSLVLTFLLRLAILDLWPVFRAGPTLMDVFSNGVAQMDTLAPLWGTNNINL